MPDVAEIRVRLTPRGGRDAIAGAREDGTLLARVSAPPADGRANQSLCRLLAKALRVAPTRVTIVRGHSAREKVVRIDGLTDADARERLGI